MNIVSFSSADTELAAIAMSLPDGLNRVDSGDQESTGSTKHDKKRVSLRWRNKQTNASVAEEGDSE